MYLKSVDGNVIYQGNEKSVKNELECAVSEGVELCNVNLRGCNLRNARLDKAKMRNACLWGADLTGANVSYADLSHCDFRTANFTDTCLAYSNCMESDFSGSFFKHTIVTNTIFENGIFSCPSIFSIILSEAKSLKGAIYKHLGEIECDLSSAPLVVKGLKKQIILMNDSTIIGADLRRISVRDDVQNFFKKSNFI